MLLTPSPVGPKQCVAILSLLHKEMDYLRKAPTQCKYPKGALDKMVKRLNRPSREVTDGGNNQGTAGAQPTTNEVKTKDHIVIPYT